MKNQYLLFFILILFVACSHPTALFEVKEQENIAPATIQFNNKSVEADSFLWSFGDGDTSIAPNPSHRYTSSGNFKVHLKAIKGNKVHHTTKIIQIKPPRLCLIEIKTPYGKMLARLSEGTPKHRDNFIELVEKGFYDNLLFHRVIPNFMIQGGDPNSRKAKEGAPLGSGGPGYTIPSEFRDSLIHIRGAIAAARKSDKVNPDKRSSGSQFYIVVGRKYNAKKLEKVFMKSPYDYSPAQKKAYLEKGGTPFLDGKYTVFGKIISGFDVLEEIATANTDERDRPKTDIPMTINIIK